MFLEHHKILMGNLNQIRYLNLIEEHTAMATSGATGKIDPTRKFNDCIGHISKSLEKLQSYIIKTNSEYERRLKENRSNTSRSKSGGQDSSRGFNSSQNKRQEEETIKQITNRCKSYDSFV